MSWGGIASNDRISTSPRERTGYLGMYVYGVGIGNVGVANHAWDTDAPAGGVLGDVIRPAWNPCFADRVAAGGRVQHAPVNDRL